MSIRFDGRVALVTGAGGGLGRTHALELARRGAKVVVNDLGGAVDGSGASSEAAQKVVDEIRALGGEALANGASVTDEGAVARLVKETHETFGRIDILVNNAGILRDKSFAKMEMSDFQRVLDIHLMGAAKVTRACWPLMREQRYGRIVMTTSPTGLFGNFGQSSYGAAKAGLVGLMHTLKLEGQKDNIHVNTIMPIAATRMTEGLFPPEMIQRFKPEQVTAGLMCLLDEQAPTGLILAAGGGFFATSQVVESGGITLPSEQVTPEAIRDRWAELSDTAGATPFFAVENELKKIIGALGKVS